MTHYVLDASVAALAFLREPGFEAARSFFAAHTPLRAPDLIYPEFTNVLWKNALRAETVPSEVESVLAEFLNLPLQITPSRELLPHALGLALETRRSAYDCLYLALAMKTNSTLVTADKRLVNALARTPLAPHVTTLAQLP